MGLGADGRPAGPPLPGHHHRQPRHRRLRQPTGTLHHPLDGRGHPGRPGPCRHPAGQRPRDQPWRHDRPGAGPCSPGAGGPAGAGGHPSRRAAQPPHAPGHDLPARHRAVPDQQRQAAAIRQQRARAIHPAPPARDRPAPGGRQVRPSPVRAGLAGPRWPPGCCSTPSTGNATSPSPPWLCRASPTRSWTPATPTCWPTCSQMPEWSYSTEPGICSIGSSPGGSRAWSQASSPTRQPPPAGRPGRFVGPASGARPAASEDADRGSSCPACWP
jgi:hypothetical protein